jgi:hypothetical protein
VVQKKYGNLDPKKKPSLLDFFEFSFLKTSDFTSKAVGDALQMLPLISAIHNAHCRRSHKDNQF